METITMYYDKHIGDHPEILNTIRSFQDKGYKVLIKGPTGCGKTVAIAKVAHELIKDEKYLDDEYRSRTILGCPNVIQNKQNESHELIRAKSLTKGDKITEKDLFVSAVYDMTYLATESNRKHHLILDEAHKKVYDEEYRDSALEQVQLCEDDAASTIHITATPNILTTGLFNYDKYLILEPKNSKANNNIEKLEIRVVPKGNRHSKLLDMFVDRYNEKVKNKEDVTILCRLNSVEEMDKVCDFMQTNHKDIKIGKLISKKKLENEIFLEIANNSKIKEGYDIILTTSLLDAGTSIQQSNIELWFHCRTAHDLVLDEIEQFLARPRQKIKKAIITTSYDEEKSTIKSFDYIKKENENKRNLIVSGLNKIIEGMKALGYSNEQIKKDIQQRLNFEIEERKTHMGCIQFDDKQCKCFINKALGEAKTFRDYDRQFYYNPQELVKKLKNRIKADKIIINSFTDTERSKDIENKVKLEKELKEEKLKEKRASVIESMKNIDISNNILFHELINSKELCIEYANEDIKELLTDIKDEKSILKDIKDLIEIGMEIQQATNIVINSKKPKDIKIAKLTYQAIKLNNNKRYSLVEDDFTKIYNIIRKHIKPIEKSRGRITDVIIEDIYNELIYYSLIKPIKKPQNKILELTGMIYNLSLIKPKSSNSKEHRYKISSLKKNLNSLK